MGHLDDEIAILARECIGLGGSACMEAIDTQILRAKTLCRWDEMSKWHRVRIRVSRLKQEQDLMESLRASRRRDTAGPTSLSIATG